MKIQLLLFFLLYTNVYPFTENEVKIIELAGKNVDLATKVYPIMKLSRNRIDNFVFSPLSLLVMMGLISEGAAGTSKSEITPFIPLSNDAYSIFLNRIYSIENKQIYNWADRIFTRDDIHLNEDFEKTAREVYRATLQKVNIKDKSSASQAIDSWINRETFSELLDILEKELSVKSLNLIYTSAIYMNMTWMQKFAVKDQVFRNKGTKKVKVPTLVRTGKYGYTENEKLDARFIEIPFNDIRYVNEYPLANLSMIIALPKKRRGLRLLEKNLHEVFERPNFIDTRIRIRLPMFSIRTTTNAKSVLRRLGVKSVFNRKLADLSNLSKYHKKRYYFSMLQQVTAIEVNQNNTEVVIIDKPIGSTRTNNHLFSVEHPFIYYIQREGVILLAGRVTSL